MSSIKDEIDHSLFVLFLSLVVISLIALILIIWTREDKSGPNSTPTQQLKMLKSQAVQ